MQSGLTNERDGLRKELGQVLAPVVRDGDLLVVKVAVLLEEVRQVWGDIEDVADAQLGQALHVGRIPGTAQVEVGQDLDGEGWQQPRWGGRGTLRIQATAHGVSVRLGFRIGAVGAQAQATEPHHWAGHRSCAWAPTAVKAGLT